MHFLNVADGSLSEVDTQLEIASRLSYIDKKTFDEESGKIYVMQKLLSGLIRKIPS